MGKGGLIISLALCVAQGWGVHVTSNGCVVCGVKPFHFPFSFTTSLPRDKKFQKEGRGTLGESRGKKEGKKSDLRNS